MTESEFIVPPFTLDNLRGTVIEYFWNLFLDDNIANNAKMSKTKAVQQISNYRDGLTSQKRLQQMNIEKALILINEKLKFYNTKIRIAKFKLMYNIQKYSTLPFMGVLKNIEWSEYSHDGIEFECVKCLEPTADFMDGDGFDDNGFGDRIECESCSLLICGLCKLDKSNISKFCKYQRKKLVDKA